MKKNVILQTCLLVSMPVQFILIMNEMAVYYPLMLLIAQSILGIIILADMIKRNHIMNFLIKEKNRKTVKWDEEEQEKLKFVRRRVELSALQSQINPHFLYNTLDSIRSKALVDGQTEIASMTEILSKFFRYCISNDENLVKIREEINHIKDYYYIQKYRFEGRLQMDIQLEDEEIYELYIPKMTLQPLVENAMIHGLEKMARKGSVVIRIVQTSHKVSITISDNGAGMNMEQLTNLNDRMNSNLLNAGTKGRHHNGIALNNVNARIKISFGDEYGIHYRSMEGIGTDALVAIPRIDEFMRVKYETL